MTIQPLMKYGTFSKTEISWWEGVSRFSKKDTSENQRLNCENHFIRFINLVRSLDLVLPPPPSGLTAYDMRGSQYLDRVIFSLSHAPKPQEQITMIGGLPKSKEEIQRQLNAHFPLAILDFEGLSDEDPFNEEGLDRRLAYPELKRHALAFIAKQPHRQKISVYSQFINSIEKDVIDKDGKQSIQPFSEDERCHLIHLILTDIKHADPKNISEVISIAEIHILAIDIKEKCGLSVFNLVFDSKWLREGREVCLDDIVKVADAVLELSEYPEAIKFLTEMKKSKESSISLFSETMIHLKKKRFKEKYPEKPLKDVCYAFTTVNGDVVNELHRSLTLKIAEDYKRISKHYKKSFTESDSQIKNTLEKLKEKAKQGWTHEDKLLVVALLRESIRRIYGILPYNTQVMALLGSIHHTLYDECHASLAQGVAPDAVKGHIAQVNTGEGKSTIVAMQAAFFALQGLCVDVISSARPLAARDQEKYAPFFDFLGVSSSNICNDDPTTENFSGLIVYGVNYDFEFSELRRSLLNNQVRNRVGKEGSVVDRPHDVVLVDEADNLFVDKGNNYAIISVPGKDRFKFLVAPILEFARDNERARMDDLESLKSHLQQYAFEGGHSYADLWEVFDESYLNRKLQDWLVSARSALYHRQENTDYVVIRTDGEDFEGEQISGASMAEQIVIVDQDTGQLAIRCRWQDRVHQFVEAKHGLSLEDENLTAASLSHPEFFNQYQYIFGLTGTMGEEAERQEVLDAFGVGSFDVPPHLKNQRIQLPTLFFESKAQYLEGIKNEVEDMLSNGRSVLILLDTINASKICSEYLNQNRIAHQLFNAIQSQDEEFIIGRAGQPGVVTVATYTAGRGTDIRLSSTVKSAGGLHVVFACYPANQRVEGQGMGRAARQGQPGSCRMILDRSDLPFSKDLPTKLLAQTETEENLMRVLQAYRSEQQGQLSYRRKMNAKVERVKFSYQNQFFDKLEYWYRQVDEDFLRAFSNEMVSAAQSDIVNMRTSLLRSVEFEPQWHTIFRTLIRNRSSTIDSKQHFSLFLNYVQQTIKNMLMEKWGAFFTELKTDVLESSAAISEYQRKSANDFERAMNKMAYWLDEPQSSFKTLVYSKWPD